jgi:hypothetical protein
MSKTILYRLFGVGKIPASCAGAIKNEGVVLAAGCCFATANRERLNAALNLFSKYGTKI